MKNINVDEQKIIDAFRQHLKLVGQPERSIRLFYDCESCYDYLFNKVKNVYEMSSNNAYGIFYDKEYINTVNPRLNATDLDIFDKILISSKGKVYDKICTSAHRKACAKICFKYDNIDNFWKIYDIFYMILERDSYNIGWYSVDKNVHKKICKKKHTCSLLKILEPVLNLGKISVFRYLVGKDELVVITNPLIKYNKSAITVKWGENKNYYSY